MQNRYPVDPCNVLMEYPRPQMVRASYYNLNGFWECAIVDKKKPVYDYPLQILVPFALETELSGIKQSLGARKELHYRRHFTLPLDEQKRTFLNFEGVDHVCTVWLNGKLLASHRGGYLPFSIEITDTLVEQNELVVHVADSSDAKPIIRGKQSRKAHGIYYTGTSGIHHTVWLEQTGKTCIKDLQIESDPAQGRWHVIVETDPSDVPVSIRYLDGKACVEGRSGERLTCKVDEVHPWSPEDPYLYPFTVSTEDDMVESYVGLRSLTIENGRLCLNGKPYYHHGLLDQGYWPLSLTTAATDQAIIDDLTLVKKLGFNMVRKHAKIESRRWYYHCDRLGLLVWQDMPSGGRKPIQPFMSGPLFWGKFWIPDRFRWCLGSQDAQYRQDFEAELVGMIKLLKNAPSIVTWVIFNEGWGQFDTKRMYELVRSIDSSRYIDPASGWYDQGVGQLVSHHVYFEPYKHTPDADGRAVVLSEFGGCVLRIQGHDEQEKVFGYKLIEGRKSFNEAFFNLYNEQVIPAVRQGLNASVYTQLSDVMQELNGLVTYDRLCVKLDEDVALQIAALLRGSQQ